MHVNKHAFTLVELSIVLVILGLLVGGVLAGQNLIRAAELRSVTTEFTNYQTAVMTFKEKYFAIPGDIDNATAFWGEQASGSACRTTASSGTATCDGDDDGLINRPTGSNELFRFWQHLANAGLVEGSFNGIDGGGGSLDTHAVPGENVPAGKLGNSAWHIERVSDKAGNVSMFDGTYGNTFYFGQPTTSGQPNTSIFTTEEAWNIDTKFDDGMPATGTIRTRTRNLCTDATSATADSDNFDAEYNLDRTGLQCAFVFPRAVE